MPDPHLQQVTDHVQRSGLSGWLNWLWGLCLTPLSIKPVREFFFGWLKRRVEEDYVTREDFENRIKGLHDDMRGRLADSEIRIIDALKENVGNLREDVKTERESSEKRFQFLEKVFLDSRLGGK